MFKIPPAPCPFLHSVTPAKFSLQPWRKATPFHYESQVWNVFLKKKVHRRQLWFNCRVEEIKFSCCEKAYVISCVYMSFELFILPNLFNHYFGSRARPPPSHIYSLSPGVLLASIKTRETKLQYIRLIFQKCKQEHFFGDFTLMFQQSVFPREKYKEDRKNNNKKLMK